MKTLKNFTAYSTGLASMNAEERTYNPPVVSGGRVRAATFAFESETTVAENAVVALATLPKGAKLLSVSFTHEAMGAGADVDLGFYDNEANVIGTSSDIAGAIDVAAAGTSTILPVAAATVGKDFTVTPAPVVLGMKVNAPNLPADKYVVGYVLYVEN